MSFSEIAVRLQSGHPGLWNLEAMMPGAQQNLLILHEIGRQAALIGYINAFMFFALTALAAMPLILAVRPPRT
jgi:hypothetical protein